jgi:phosphatidylglycerol:prolipoprotein diacylglycerol transferase
VSPAILTALTSLSATGPLGLDPVVFHIGRFALRWYSLAYLAGIVVGWWYLLKLTSQPGSPMARRHADDFVFYATLGIIIGGRAAYVLFYDRSILADPVEILKLWNGGMSFHGGLVGVSLGIFYLAWKNKLNWLRIHDYVACCAPFGLFFGRLANFVNGELWGAPTNLPWGVVFPSAGDGIPRHPTQLYEAALEGVLMFVLLWYLFWKTDSRYEPGKLLGAGLLGYGVCRFLVEFVREPDRQLVDFATQTGLHMGQWLSLPMILLGLYLVVTAKARRRRVEPIAGSESVA